MRIGRVVFFFGFAFGSIIIPVVVALLIALLTIKPPFVIDPAPEISNGRMAALVEPGQGDVKEFIPDVVREYPGAQAAARILFNDNANVTLIKYESDGMAEDEYRHVANRIPRSGQTSTPGRIRYTRKDPEARGLVFATGAWVIAAEAANDDVIEEHLNSLPFLKPQEKSFMTALVEDHLAWLFVVIGIYIVILALAFPRMGSWAARTDAVPNVAPVGTDELKQRLMAINDMDQPVQVMEGKRPNELIVEWKYADEKWAGIMAAGRVKSLARIRLRLDPAQNRVRAQDAKSTVRWQSGAYGVMSAASVRWVGFKGISFYDYAKEQMSGLIFKDGRLTFDKAYEYRFHFGEMKRPIIETITGSGWDYVPVVTFLRIFN
jgi:hypothetical protein